MKVIFSHRTIIRVGEYNQTADVDCAENVCAPKAQNIPIAETIAHESYDVTEKKENDIAIIRMKKHVALGRKCMLRLNKLLYAGKYFDNDNQNIMFS